MEEVGAHRQPDVPPPSRLPILEDDCRQLATLAHAGPITQEEASSAATGQRLLMALARVCDRLELEA